MLNLEEPIFCHPNGRPIGSFKKGFEQALNEAGVLRGSDGKKRVPYSLRHTYATMRISEGVSVFQLAANMGTSVEMIESFYGKKRMRDPKMATEVTKFRGRWPPDKCYTIRSTRCRRIDQRGCPTNYSENPSPRRCKPKRRPRSRTTTAAAPTK